MNAKTLIAVATVAAAFSGMARAGEADLFANGTQFQGQNLRAEVQAQAVQAAKTARFGEADASTTGVQTATGSRDAVKAQTLQAVRLGQIPNGEASF